MFWSILKKDLKRKKTMNVILLLFVILCSMFAAASVNNIFAVTGGIENYFEAAEVPDVIADMVMNSENAETEKKIQSLPSVTQLKTEERILLISSKNIKYNGTGMDNYTNPPLLISDREWGTKYYDSNNKELECSIPKGSFYATSPFSQGLDIAVGDEFELELDGFKQKLTYLGSFKGAQYPNFDQSTPYILINSEDFDEVKDAVPEDRQYSHSLYINMDNTDELNDVINDSVYISTRENLKGIYTYDMFAAYILLAISIVLMVTAFVVLRFTINFTISEEFREIGVMKAVGIDNTSIRGLYIVKYFAISVVGAALGFLGSIPLSNAMMASISKNLIFGTDGNILTGALSSAAVIAVIMLFCYGCTGKIKKLSPIDAVRNGQTGERFKKKNLMHLGSSKLPATGFLSANDVVSAPRRFALITVIFALCALMIMLMSSFALTLKSDKLLWLFDVPETEAHILDLDYMQNLLMDMTDHQATLEKTEKMLEDNGIKGKASVMYGTQYNAVHGDKERQMFFMVQKGIHNDLLKADEGSMPQKPDEVALTGYALKDLNAKIGDTISVDMHGKEYKFIITGKFSTFQGGGHAIQLHDDFELENNDSFTTMGINIHFDGNPDQAEINNNIEIIKKAIGSDKVYNTSDLIKTMTSMSDTLNAIKKLMMAVTVVLIVLIVILMERSFISKEKSEIALMKAVGISNGSIISQHALRFVIVSILACILSFAGLTPISNALMDFICSMIGDVSGIHCDIDPVEIFAVCPAILIGITVIGSFLTALYTNTINAADTASIE